MVHSTLMIACAMVLTAGAPMKPQPQPTKQPVENPKKKAAPPPKATAGATPSARECESYLSHLIDLQAGESVAAIPEVQAMNEKERAVTVARVRDGAAKLPEAQRELKDCLGGKLNRAELECTLSATSASAAAECAGL